MRLCRSLVMGSVAALLLAAWLITPVFAQEPAAEGAKPAATQPSAPQAYLLDITTCWPTR